MLTTKLVLNSDYIYCSLSIARTDRSVWDGKIEEAGVENVARESMCEKSQSN